MAGANTTSRIPEFLKRLMRRENLDGTEVYDLFLMVLNGVEGPEEIAAFLIAMAMKGETGIELAGAARAVRQFGNPISLSIPTDSILDTCGTGGDGSRTFNISTATSLVVASAGVPVVKHGNRAVSSSSGSADVLSHLGVNTTLKANEVQNCLQGSGMAFCLAPLYHPVLKKVAVIREKLKVPTIFNRLGPLCNPAGAANQLIGVGKLEWLSPMAEASRLLGIRRAFLVHSLCGLDEVSLCSSTLVHQVHPTGIVTTEWEPGDFGLPLASLEDLRADSPEESARIIKDILEGAQGPARDVVLANAAASFLLVEKVGDLREGVKLGQYLLDSGLAKSTLEKLSQTSQIIASSRS